MDGFDFSLAKEHGRDGFAGEDVVEASQQAVAEDAIGGDLENFGKGAHGPDVGGGNDPDVKVVGLEGLDECVDFLEHADAAAD